MRFILVQRLRRAGVDGIYEGASSEEGRKAYARALEGRGTYLWGSPGTGKTYAAACAVRLWVEGGGDAKLVSARDLLRDEKDGWGTGCRSGLSRAESYGLLALDDLGAEKVTDWTMEAIEGLVDARARSVRPTIVTSNLRLGQLRDLWGGVAGMRIASRVAGCCATVEMRGPDRRIHG